MKYELLKNFLKSKGVKFKNLAKEMGISRCNFSKKINRIAGADFKPDEIRFICRKYNLDANVIFLLSPSLIRNAAAQEKIA